MKKTKSTKRALLLSGLSLLLCMSMFIGTTFAWFTDSVSSTNNIIKSGNLDVVLEYATLRNGVMSAWSEVDGTTPIFDNNALWEPGYTEVIYLRVKNAGSLALKYQLGVNIISETPGTNVNDEEFYLSDYINFGVVETSEENTFANRDAARAAVANSSKIISKGYAKSSELYPAGTDGKLSEEYVTMVVYMPEEVDNVANHKTGTEAPEINLGINLFATQLTYEEDSFDNKYDADSLFCDVTASPANAQEVINNAAEGTIIGLVAGDYGDLVIQNADGSAKKNITLVSKSAVVDSVNLNGSIGITLDGLTFDANAGTTVWGYSAKDGAQDKGYVASITDATQGRANYGSQDITVKNCTFTNTTDAVAAADVADYYCIMTTNYRSSREDKNYTIENCVFACNAVQYIALNYVKGEVVITNNTFGGGDYGTSHNTINATSNSANWTIAGNEFNNWNVEKAAIGSSRSTANGITTWTVTDNEFNNADETVILALKTSYNADNSVVTVKNNTVLNGNGTIVSTGVDATGDDVYAGYMIDLNDGVVRVANVTELQNAWDSATDGSVICLINEITGNVTLTQKADVDVVIDGNGYIFNGVMTVFGNARKTGAETLTIKNINFVAANDAVSCIVSPSRDVFNKYSYSHNVTVVNCTFTDPDGVVNCAAIRTQNGGDMNWTVENCTVDSTMHSILQVANVEGSLEITNCTIESKEGINVNQSANVTITGCTADVQGYAVRFGAGSGSTVASESYTIKDCTLKSANNEGDATIILRGTAADATLTISNTTIVGNPDITNGTNANVTVDGAKYVTTTQELINAIKNAPVGEETVIVMADGTYAGDINITVAALGASGGDVVIKAMGKNAVIAGTVTIGYRQQNVGAASYDAKVTFDGITFDHAEAGKHCLNVQDVESFYMVNCTVIGDGEYGLSTPGSNGTGSAKIEKCKFINAGLQLAGKFAQTLVIDYCEFEESVINVQGGGPLGPTIQNSTFDITLKDAHNGESFYVIRNSNAGANIEVTNCDINVNSEMTSEGTAGSKGWGVFVNRIASYDITVENVRVTMTDAALEQSALKVATCLSTGKINMTTVTLNGEAVQ